MMNTLFYSEVGDDLISDLVSKEALLWLTSYDQSIEPSPAALADLIELPWLAVVLEQASKDLVKEIETRAAAPAWVPVRGFLHLISSDPSGLTLPRRSQPIYLLGGLQDKLGGPESASLPARTALRRRLNMIDHAASVEPTRIYVVGPNPAEALEDFAELWQQGRRSLLTIVCDDRSKEHSVKQRLADLGGLASIVWLELSASDFSAQVAARTSALLRAENLYVRVKLSGERLIEANLSLAEHTEQPVADTCEFIAAKDLFLLNATDLTEQEVKNFFTRESLSWRPFAAGLPWQPDSGPIIRVQKLLGEVLAHEDYSGPRILTISAESGSGGTTLARSIAFAAAQSGYIPIVFKQHAVTPSALEIVGFMYRALDAIQAALGDTADPSSDLEPAWLVVLDTVHFDRLDADLVRFYSDLVRSGRKFLLLKVTRPETPIDTPVEAIQELLADIGHNIDHDDVRDLGAHLNRFLKPHGRERSMDLWLKFWEEHRPDVNPGLASFWIALEFWLAGYLQLGESIQEWVLRQFKHAKVSNDIKVALLEIAAFSVERRALPESLLAPLENPSLPWLQALEKLRSSAPAVGAFRVRSQELGNVWAIAHDVLARYLINGAHRDVLFIRGMGLAETSDPVAFRLARIRDVCLRPSIADTRVRPLVLLLATSTLKLDEQAGNAELFKHWRTVLNVLDGIPAQVRESSRTFNHHLAISRRRVCLGDLFGATESEQRALLEKAESEVKFALERISPTGIDESDLNLYNTLALIYQDLASLERKTGNRGEVVADYLEKSDEATKRALSENPSNSYVLETAARNLLRRAPDLDAVDRVRFAAEALSFVQQAFALDSADRRRQKLGKLADDALAYLRVPDAAIHIERLCGQGSAFGYMAKAWIGISNAAQGRSTAQLLEEIDPSVAKAALTILEQAPEREWPLVKLMYELQAVAEPSAFEQQLLLLEELSSFAGFRLSLQQQLERAVLLHQRGRHKDASSLFATIRRDAKASGVILYLPQRLRWLYGTDGATRLICSAQFVDSGIGRASAQVRELGGISVPLRPQEFGKEKMNSGERFKAWVSFGPMGPFLKPVESVSR